MGIIKYNKLLEKKESPNGRDEDDLISQDEILMFTGRYIHLLFIIQVIELY